MTPNPAPSCGRLFTAFLLLAASIMITLGWNLFLVVKEHQAANALTAQMNLTLVQAMQTEEKFKVLVADLIELAKTDLDAETIVKRYHIAFTPPPDTTSGGSK